MRFKISIAQINIQTGAYLQNFTKASQLIHQASTEGSHLVLLPELWLGGYDYAHFSGYLRECDSYREEIRNLARSERIYIGGTLPVRTEGGVFNSFILVGPDGTEVQYRKIHLFSQMRETNFFSPGSSPRIVNTPFGATGLAICYDLRFPELFRVYGLKPTSLVLISAEWPRVRIDHWKTLVRARAIENQYFVAVCNAVGKTGKIILGGTSMICDPAGSILAEGDELNEGLITATLDPTLIEVTRNSIPVMKDRRPEIYG